MKHLLANVALILNAAPSDAPHIFVTGAPRSGTSLIKAILAGSPEIAATSDESTGLIRVRNYQRYTTPDVPLSQIQHHLAKASSIVEVFDRVGADVVGSQPPARFFCDKVNVRRWRFRTMVRLWPNARFVAIVRDGRDSYASAKKHDSVHQAGSPRRYAEYWRYCSHVCSTSLPAERTADIRYEDLVKSPLETMRYVMDFLELPFSEELTQSATYSASTNLDSRPHHANLAKPLSTTSIGKWKESLTQDEIATFAAIAGDELQRRGYVD